MMNAWVRCNLRICFNAVKWPLEHLVVSSQERPAQEEADNTIAQRKKMVGTRKNGDPRVPMPCVIEPRYLKCSPGHKCESGALLTWVKSAAPEGNDDLSQQLAVAQDSEILCMEDAITEVAINAHYIRDPSDSARYSNARARSVRCMCARKRVTIQIVGYHALQGAVLSPSVCEEM